MSAELFLKVCQNDEVSVRELLANGVNPNCRDFKDYTPLHRAAGEANSNIVSMLLAYGADVEAAATEIETKPLKIAVIRDSQAVVRILLNKGASLNAADLKGYTALHLATAQNHCAMVDTLLAHGASPDLPDEQGMTPLHLAAYFYHEALTAAKETDNRLADAPPLSGAELDNGPGGCHSVIFSALLKHSSQPDLQDNDGNTPLHHAAMDGYHQAVCQLLTVTANLDIANHEGCTPLHLAARGGHSADIRALLEHGFQPDQKNNDGNTPLHLALSSEHLDAVQEMMAATLKPDSMNDKGVTALQSAVCIGRTDMVRTIMDNGANPDICSHSSGSTALHYAVAIKNRKCIDLLLINGAQTNIKNHHGFTPLEVAKEAGDEAVINQITNPPPRQPHSLQRSCRAAIRTRLIAIHPRQPLSATIDKLNCLPTVVRDYLYSSLVL